MEAIRLVIVCTAFIFTGRVRCFFPHDVSVTNAGLTDSKHHAKITSEALEKIVDWFLQENTDLYPVEMHDKLKNSHTFKSTMSSFKSFVAKYDTFSPYDKDPSYHFSAEKLAESNMRIVLDREKVINAIKLKTFDVARVTAGLLFHTLQDFYSSTNWIELGNQMFKEELGTTSAFESVVFASPDEKTCSNCEPLGECRGNIRSNIRQEKKLISGYYSKHNVDKPEGKCGHGGKADSFRVKDAKGGINKDTSNSDWSPHHYLHQQAADMAVESTVDMLKRIYEATIDDRESFGEFLGMELLTSLCFIIDTTGSMGDEIEDVKRLTIEMTKGAERTGKNFVLVPINDPHPNIIHMTNDANEMVELLGGLVADGGGDIPEMSMSGMLLAAQNVRFGSKCYVFTDADAKDKDIKETLKGVLTSRNVKMDFKLTIVNKKRKRSTRKRRSIADDYRDIAEVSGGSITLVQKGHLKEVLKIVDIESKISSVDVAYGYLSSNPSFNFYVDSTMNETYLEVSVIGTNIQEINITSPSGRTNQAELLANVPNNKVLKITNPDQGEWTANISLTAQNFKYFYRVFSESSIDFTYTLVSENGAPVEFSPIRGKDYYVSLDMFGSIDEESLKLVFLSTEGSILKEIKVKHSSSNFVAKSALPMEATGFFVGVQGVDSKGKKFQRINSNIIKTSYVTAELNLAANESLDIKPGSSIKVKAKLSNRGTPLDKWKVNIFDSSNFLVGTKTLDFTVATNVSVSFDMIFTAPTTAVPGRVSTVTLSIVATSDPKVKNVLVFYVSVIPKESDLNSPWCKVLSITEDICKGKRSLQCNSTRWNATVSVQDLDSGLKSFKASTSYAQSLFSPNIFPNGTKEEVTGVYESSCCFLNATIIAVDYNGNVGRCTLKVNSASSVDLAIVCCFLFVLLHYFKSF